MVPVVTIADKQTTMIYTVDRYNKIKSCISLDPTIFTEAKSRAVKMHLTLANIVELALNDYLEKTKAQEQEKVKQDELTRKKEEAEEVERFNHGSIPPASVFRHFLGDE
jgi:DNA-binding transcriptional regulator GbsR (MarR family)